MTNTIYHRVFDTVYPEDTVGSMMAREMVVLPPLMRVNEAVERVRQVGFAKDFLSNCYVIGEDFTLRGLVNIRNLILAKGGQRLETIMEQPAATIGPEADQEEAVHLMAQHDLLELPVLDDQRHLLGIVTADDAIDVQRDEATEDMEMMAAITPSEQPYLQTKVGTIYRSRIFWLLLLMLSATFTGAIISHFESALAAQVALTAFIPMLMDTGGNCGSQSSVTIIRGLSLGEIQFKDWLKVAWKELQVAALCGLTLGTVNLLRLMLFSDVGFTVALVVCLTLVVTVLASKLLGCLLPIAASRAGLDPAVMASPLITTVSDAVSLLVYFRIAGALLHL